MGEMVINSVYLCALSDIKNNGMILFYFRSTCLSSLMSETFVEFRCACVAKILIGGRPLCLFLLFWVIYFRVFILFIRAGFFLFY